VSLAPPQHGVGEEEGHHGDELLTRRCTVSASVTSVCACAELKTSVH